MMSPLSCRRVRCFFTAFVLLASAGLAQDKQPDGGPSPKPLRDPTPEEREKFAQDVRSRRTRPLSYRIGDPAPALDVGRWSDGKQRTLKDFAGKVVVLEFTASWCAPCRADAAVMKKIAAKYKDDVVFIGITAADATDEELKPWLEQDQWPPNLGVDAADEEDRLGKTAKKYGVFLLPNIVVVDRLGNISYSDELQARHPISDEQLQKLYAAASKFLGRKWPPEDKEAISPKELVEIDRKLLELRTSLQIDEALSRKGSERQDK